MQAQEKGLLTSGTFGRTGIGSLGNASLLSSLESKLRARTGSVGSILYRLTWSARVTPSGRSISALRASDWNLNRARRAKGFNGPYTLVLIPTSPPSYVILPIGLAHTLSTGATIFGSVSILSGWPTSNTMDSIARDGLRPSRAATGRESGYLSEIALLAGWTTANARDWKDTGWVKDRNDGKKRLDQLGRQAMLAGWTTTGAKDAYRTSAETADDKKARGANTGWSLIDLAVLASWPTPDASVANLTGDPEQHELRRERMAEKHGNNGAGRPLALAAAVLSNGPVRATGDGTILIGCSAQMDAGGQLNPDHSRWLMRFNRGWGNSPPLGTRSTTKRRAPSSRA